jgi:two-component system nitrogen regulation response regulator GlnG
MATPGLSVWVVDDDESVRWVLEQALKQAHMMPRSFASGQGFFTALRHDKPDVLVTDIRMPDMTGLELMERLSATEPDIPVIVITAHSDLDSAVSAYQAGAFEYLPKPFDIDEAMELVSRAAKQSSRGAPSEEGARPVPRIIGQAPAMQEVFRAIGRLSRSSMTVLITGESGTGKELVARALHENSPRADKPFVALNTSAIAAELLESELFGHEKGAFTGAGERRIGRFEQANGGTLFLDEIGDMSAALQTRLLRVLAEKEFFRVGGQTAVRVDVRVIAATHQELGRAVQAGRFREDLFHRLNVMRIEVPPLRHRKEDIPELARVYLEQAASELGVAPKTLSSEALGLLLKHDWPGNVRELVNLCRRLTVTAAGREISAHDLPKELGGAASLLPDRDWTTGLAQWAESRLAGEADNPLLDEALPAFERTLIVAALRRARGKRLQAAKLLGWGRNTLTRKIKELGLEGRYCAPPEGFDALSHPSSPRLHERPAPLYVLHNGFGELEGEHAVVTRDPAWLVVEDRVEKRVGFRAQGIAFLQIPCLLGERRLPAAPSAGAADQPDLASTKVDRQVLVVLEHAEFALRGGRDPGCRHVGNRAGIEFDPGVGNVDARRQHRDANGGDLRRRAADQREDHVQVVDHQIQDDVDLDAPWLERSESMTFYESDVR